MDGEGGQQVVGTGGGAPFSPLNAGCSSASSPSASWKEACRGRLAELGGRGVQTVTARTAAHPGLRGKDQGELQTPQGFAASCSVCRSYHMLTENIQAVASAIYITYARHPHAGRPRPCIESAVHHRPGVGTGWVPHATRQTAAAVTGRAPQQRMAQCSSVA